MTDLKNEILKREKHDINSLRQIMAYLRSDDGCSWDRAQTHESIRANLIEETYEVIEAIDNDDKTLMREELGDVLLQVVFHSRIEEEQNSFTLDDVIEDICEKLIRRHPHVFKNVVANNEERALDAWDKAKKEEKNGRSVVESMKALPPSLPALMKAQKVVKKALKDNYNFGSADEILDSLEAKIKEARAFVADGVDIEEQVLGELIFQILVLSSANNINMEDVLNKTTRNFIEKYTKI